MAFLGSQYGGMVNQSMYGGGMYGGGMNNMYGGGMGMNQMQQQNGQNPDQQQQDYQFDFRRDIQATVGGLNASLGLAFGATQMVRLCAIGIKYIFKAVKFVLLKIFNYKNITEPIKFLLRLLIGTDFTSRSTPRNQQSLEALWRSSDPGGPNDPRKNWNLFGIPAAIVKSLLVGVFAIALQLIGSFIRRHKERKLQELQKKEEEERERRLDEQFKLLQEKIQTEEDDFVKVFPHSQNETIDVSVYDGELNQMNFNHVKGSRAFTTQPQLDDDWFYDSNNSTNASSLFNSEINERAKAALIKKSEDGWNRANQNNTSTSLFD